MALRFNRGFNVGRVVSRLVYTILALYVGGTIMTTFGEVMNGTTSPFYSGLTLIGWTVSSNTITDTTGAGVLAVVGVIGIASVVLEFIRF